MTKRDYYEILEVTRTATGGGDEEGPIASSR